VVEAFPTTPLLVEIKAPLAATEVRRIIERHNAVDRVLVDSFTTEALKVFAGSDIAIGATRSDAARLLWEIVAGRPITPITYRALCVPLSYYGMPLPIRRFAQIVPEYDCRLHIWTINDPDVARELWTAGVSGIISDDPGVMLELRRMMPQQV
jgi:glycerophosphoryl diester phosphodiesterase